MIRWNRAHRDSVRFFRFGHQHIAFVTGTRSRRCADIRFVRMKDSNNGARFALQCACSGPEMHEGSNFDNYYILSPLVVPQECDQVMVLHREGSEKIAVESIGVMPETGDTVAADRRPAAVGISQNFSLEEAFRNAIENLGMPIAPEPHRSSLVDIVAMGALYGGCQGFSRLFVKVEKSEICGRLL